MNGNIKTILFPTDYSDAANNALNVAIAMAKRQNAILHLLHVVVPQYTSVVGDTTFNVSAADWIEVETQNKISLEKIANAINNEYKINVKANTKIGYVSESVERSADELEADIIIMGTHGISGIREFFIGSNAYSVLKNANCPVLTIPLSSKKTAFENVLFPVRNVDGVLEKYKAITQILKANESKVELLGVAHFNNFLVFDRITDTVHELKRKMENENIEVIHRNEFCENIANFVLAYAEVSNTDLLVINATIDNDWKRFFLGSYAQKIVNHAACPVLSIKPKVTTLELQNSFNAQIMEAKKSINKVFELPQISVFA